MKDTCKQCTGRCNCGRWKATAPVQSKDCSKLQPEGRINPPPSGIVQEAIDYRNRCVDELDYDDVWGGSTDGIYDFNVWYDETKCIVGVQIYAVVAGATNTDDFYNVDPSAFNTHPEDRDPPPSCAACGKPWTGEWHEGSEANNGDSVCTPCHNKGE
jgi:hypothetical protein